ncbi:MipA/OmpV family protein [Vibrio sp.]|nr:MipA/OmpV family protein [Vibrio sp.]
MIKRLTSSRGLRLSFLTISVLYAANTLANGSIGAGIGFGQSEYKDYDGDATALPVINYEDDLLYFHGVSGGVFLLKGDYSAVTLGVSYFPKDFDASDSDDIQLQQLDDRDSTGMVDVGYRYTDPFLGSISATLSADFLDKTDGGWKVDLGYQKRFQLSQRITITPGFGVNWFNEDLNNHYYGINAGEAERSGLNQYHPDGSAITYAELGANVFLTKNLSLFVNGRYNWLDSEVTDSPMVDTDHFFGAMIGMNFIF